MELLERASFLRTLAEYGDQAALGNGRLVLLSGESGIGKTVLLEGFQRQLAGTRWLWGACDGLLTPRPLGPVFDIAGQLGGELDELCRTGAPRDRMFAAFLAELDAPGELTVAVIEDVHWADEATTDLLSYLGRRLGRMRALVLCTYRDDELAPDHPLRVVLGDLATQRASRRMRLPPLTEDGVRALAGPRGVDAAELYRATGGNPFYVSEILAAGWPSVPPTVRDAVGARLARAGAVTREAVEAAAIIGARVDRPLLTLLTGTGPAGTGLAGTGSAVDDCLETGILVPDGTGLRFRHELVRMAVETAIAPHRKLELHARLLAALEERGGADSAVLAHHAEGAGDAAAVLRHAPEAGRRSRTLGAHREAAAQFERALRYAGEAGPAALAPLHEGLAGEYALLDRWQEAEAELRVALRLRRELGDDLSIAGDLRMLANALWRLCRGQESGEANAEAVRILEARPPGRELAWAYANLAAHLRAAGQCELAITTGRQALAMGEELGEPEIVSHAQNTIGCAMLIGGQDGLALLEQALATALRADLQEAAGRAYTNLQTMTTDLHRFDEAERYFGAGMVYCEGRELGVYSTCLNGGRACMLLLLGRWDEAAEICAQMLASRGSSPVNRLNPLRVLGLIRGRRGDADGAWELLDEALASAEGTAESQWIVPVRAARAELSWLLGDPERAVAEARAGRDGVAGHVEAWILGSVVIWLPRLHQADQLPSGLPEPYAREAAGDFAGAAVAWDRLGRPYDAALSWLGSSDEEGLRQALAALDELGARAAAAATRRRMRELGMTAIPRGPRPATRAAPAGLTAREQEVLALLAEGLADLEISRRLFISERTVHHHVSAVLSKVGVSSRTAAAREAARLGIGSPAG
jgi:DNA-binding CsgD family transcriptional regulator